MIKKGFELFQSSVYSRAGKISVTKEPRCCEICIFCIFPFTLLCRPFCKFRKATYHEWLWYSLEKDEKKERAATKNDAL